MPAEPNGKKLFFKIGEVSRMTGIKPFVLRYWETEFPLLSPRKSRGRQRVYRREEIDLIRKIRRLLYREGYTIAGARRRLSGREGKRERRVTQDLAKIREELQQILEVLSK